MHISTSLLPFKPTSSIVNTINTTVSASIQILFKYPKVFKHLPRVYNYLSTEHDITPKIAQFSCFHYKTKQRHLLGLSAAHNMQLKPNWAKINPFKKNTQLQYLAQTIYSRLLVLVSKYLKNDKIFKHNKFIFKYYLKKSYLSNI